VDSGLRCSEEMDSELASDLDSLCCLCYVWTVLSHTI
jgi:hypothetical protein